VVALEEWFIQFWVRERTVELVWECPKRVESGFQRACTF